MYVESLLADAIAADDIALPTILDEGLKTGNVTSDCHNFAKPFAALTTQTEAAAAARKTAWNTLDPSNKGHISLDDTRQWIMSSLVDAMGTDEGKRLYDAFYECITSSFSHCSNAARLQFDEFPKFITCFVLNAIMYETVPKPKIDNTNEEKQRNPPLPDVRRSRFCSFRSMIVLVFTMAMAIYIKNSLFFYSELATALFFANGLWYVVVPQLLSAISGTEANHTRLCNDDLPFSNWVWDRLAQEALSLPSVPPRPVKKVSWDDQEAACQENLLSPEGLHEPFVIPGYFKYLQEHSLTPEHVLADAHWLQNLSVINMRGLGDNFEEVKRCPHKRKLYHGTHPAKPILGREASHLYAAFDMSFLAPENVRRNNSVLLRVINGCLANLEGFCQGRFRGIPGEAFMGFGAQTGEPFRIGTIMHAAGMGNLFLQIAGTRQWTLIHPAHSQYIRPRHGMDYVLGVDACTDWKDMKRPAHFDRIPRWTITTRPGDVLYIPPWYWHETVLHEPGEFSLGMSTRSRADMVSSWREWPVIRFLPWVTGWDRSSNPMVLDWVHGLPHYIFRLPFANVQDSQYNDRSA